MNNVQEEPHNSSTNCVIGREPNSGTVDLEWAVPSRNEADAFA